MLFLTKARPHPAIKKATRLGDFQIFLEQMRGIEPPLQPWQGRVLPLNYICVLIY